MNNWTGIQTLIGLTQNHEKTNRQVRQVRQGIRVAESFCVSPALVPSLIN
jgi:hypothetical protein